MNRMRVYMIGPSLNTQGGISSVLKVYEKNYSQCYDLRFIPTYSGKSRLKDCSYFAAAILKVFAASLLHKDALFHIHTASRGSYFRKSILANICFAFGRKVIFHIHGGKFDEFMQNAGESKRKSMIGLLNRVEKVVVLSDKWQNYFKAFVPEDKLTVIYNPSPVNIERYLERQNPKVRILFIGRIWKLKGVYDLIEAIKTIEGDHFTLSLYGDGEVNEMKELVKSNALSNKVSANDWISHDEIIRKCKEADILVLPSYAEGLPMSILEAMGCGLPVIATNVGGVPEAVVDGENGFIVEPGDTKALAEKLKILINDKNLREKMGRKGLKMVKDKFSTQRVNEELSSMYKLVMSR